MSLDLDESQSQPLNLIQTPLPYLSGIAHMGTIAQAVRADLICKLANCYRKDTIFPYSFHVTGLPVAQKIDRIVRASRTQSINDCLEDQGLGHLSTYLWGTFNPLELPHWYELFTRYYKSLFSTLKLDSTLVNPREGLSYHTTTGLEPGYDKFIVELYQKLHDRGLIIEKEHPMIYCDACKLVLGDHERRTGEGLGLITMDPGVQKLPRGLNPNQTVVCFDGCNARRGKLSEFLTTRGTIHVLVEGVICRCGTPATIALDKTMFVSITDSWKAKTLSLLENLDYDPKVMTILRQSITNLRDYAFLRRGTGKGYGSRLPFLKGTRYEDAVIDPLGDTPLHIYYWSTLNPRVRSRVYITAHDLLTNHVTLMLYFISGQLFSTGVVPGLVVSGYLLGVDNYKMSKSRGNVITIESLALEGISGRDLRHYISNLADNMNATRVNFEDIRTAGRVGQRHRVKFLAKLKDYGKGPNTDKILARLHRLIRPWDSGKNSAIRLRKIYHTLFHELSTSLEKTGPSLPVNLITDLINVFV